MQTVQYSIHINAPVKKVWDIMLGEETYSDWTQAFNPDSRYEGTWEEGSKMLFLGPDPKTGELGGMISMVRENRPYEYISVEHIGIVHNGVEDTTSEEMQKWTPAFENYSFEEKDGGTQLTVEMDLSEEHKDMFEEMWPNALKRLKELAE